MNEDFESGLDAIMEGENGLTGNLVVKVVAFLIWALSAITTFAFFATYAPGIGEWISAENGWVLAGLQGAFLLDTLAFVWGYLSRLRGATTKQISIAQWASYGTLAGGVIVSFLFVLFSVSLQVGLRDASGLPTRLGLGLEWIGTLVMTFAYVGNFTAAFFYTFYSYAAQEALNTAGLQAIQLAGKAHVKNLQTKMVIGNTVRGIAHQLPDRARAAGEQNTQRYINRNFGDLNGDGRIDERDEQIHRQRNTLTPANEPKRPNGVIRHETDSGGPVVNLSTAATGEDGVDPFLPIRS